VVNWFPDIQSIKSVKLDTFIVVKLFEETINCTTDVKYLIPVKSVMPVFGIRNRHEQY